MSAPGRVGPRDVVIVGTGQLVQRPDDPRDALEPLALMLEAVGIAATDSGRPGILRATGAIGVLRGAWSYPDPGRLIADRIDAPAARTVLTTVGGQHPQTLLNTFGRRIRFGDLDVALIVGAEAIHSRRRLRAAGITMAITAQDATEPDEIHGSDDPMLAESERERGVDDTTQIYALFENALRHARGETVTEHRDRLGHLWAGFNAVAVENTYAWLREPMSAAEIREPSPQNRFIGFPYTKSMNSNWYVDQSAAIIVCAAEAALSVGIPKDRWIFARAGTQAHDTQFVSNRLDLHSSPAIRVAGRRLFELAGADVDDVAHVDLYSCFPSAVQIAAQEIGLSEERPLTVTGGLTFAGGPYGNYVTHSIATMAGVLREDPGSLGLVTANGGFLSKHALGLFSGAPGPDGFLADDVQAEVDELGFRAEAADHDGEVIVEAATVMFGRDGPERAIVACLTSDGRRAWGGSTDPTVMNLITTEGLEGRTAWLRHDGVVEL